MEISADNFSFSVDALAKMVPFNPGYAKRLLDENGLDEVFILIGEDTYIAYGQGFDFKKIQPGVKVNTPFGQGLVVDTENDNNSPWENIKARAWGAIGLGTGTTMTLGSIIGMLMIKGGGNSVALASGLSLMSGFWGVILAGVSGYFVYDAYQDGKKIPVDKEALNFLVSH